METEGNNKQAEFERELLALLQKYDASIGAWDQYGGNETYLGQRLEITGPDIYIDLQDFAESHS
jgi:hypothetical protein